VFWGFLVVTIGTVEIFIQGLADGFSFANALPRPLYALYALSQEAFALLILAAVSYLIYRRLVIKPRRLQGDEVHGTEAVAILSVIAVLMLTLILTGTMEAITDPSAPAGVRARRVAGARGGAARGRSRRTPRTSFAT
jgi:hypothetical protein